MVVQRLCGSCISLMIELPVEVWDVALACFLLLQVGFDPDDVCYLVNLGP